MVKVDAQTYLRQQLGFARYYISNLSTLESLQGKRAGINAAILSLEEGIREYSNQVLSTDTIRLSQVIDFCGSEAALASVNNFMQQELISLAGEADSWLTTLAALRDSMTRKVAETSGKASSQAGGGPVSNQLIATSNAKPTLWYETPPERLSEIADAASELLTRHSETDIEY